MLSVKTGLMDVFKINNVCMLYVVCMFESPYKLLSRDPDILLGFVPLAKLQRMGFRLKEQ
jgi:hypothetical protein